MFKVYDKEWKKIFSIVNVNENGQFVDENGVAHNKGVVREVRSLDNLGDSIEYS